MEPGDGIIEFVQGEQKEHQEGDALCKPLGNQRKEHVACKQGGGEHTAGEQGDDGQGGKRDLYIFHSIG